MERKLRVERTVWLCLFAILSTNVLLINGQLIEAHPRNITVGEGQTVTMLFKTSSPLIYCRFEIPGIDQGIRVSEKRHKPPFKYFGRGLDEGECGISFEQVKPINNGKAKCILGLAEGGEVTEEIDLTVTIPPFRPEIQPNIHGQFHVDQELQLTCTSRNGRPAAQLSWFLDDEQLIEGVSRPHITEEITSENTTLYTVAFQLNFRRLQASDDHRFLICRSIHPADQPQEDRMQLLVRYRPQPISENRIHILPLGRTALVNVEILANPRPRIEWAVDGKRIREGNQIERYEAYQPIDLGNHTYNVTLAITGLNIQDTTKTYYLKAANEFGQQDYSIEIKLATETANINTD